MRYATLVEALQIWWPILLQDFLRYFITASGFYAVFWVWKREAWRHLRIQKPDPEKQQLWSELKYSLSTVIIFSLNGPLLVYLMRHGHAAIYLDIAERGVTYFAVSIVVWIVLHDTYFYWTHRAMHHPLIYRHVHRVHHRSTHPTPWTSYAFHPFEAVVEAAFFPVFAMVIPAHPLALFAFLLYMIVRNVMGHLGYEVFPRSFATSSWTSWHTTATHHDLHHRFVHRNYGLYFTWWDRLMKTTHPDYVETFEQVRSRAVTTPRSDPLSTGAKA